MAVINRVGSPMHRLDESLDESPEKINLRKQLLKAQQRTKSPFVIGSIEDVNIKISKLDQKLQSYTALVCESRASNYEEEKYRFSNTKGREQYNKNAKEAKEIHAFAGIYTMRSSLAPTLSERVKNINKISMKTKTKAAPIVSKGDIGKPKFVEPYSKSEFDTLLYSRNSEAIFLDIFWYIFLDRFQQNPAIQVKLFDRVAHNYVKLMMSGGNVVLKDLFFKNYPMLTSQAIYSAFCFSFPDSYRQFGEHFKNYLTFLIYGWMAGLRPAPRSWLSWQMSTLEPANLKQRENLMNKKNGSSILNLNYLDSLVTTNSKDTTSSSSADVSTSRSSTHSNFRTKKQRIAKKLYSPSSSYILESVEAAQNSTRPQKEGKGRVWVNDLLTPIQEIQSEEEDEITKSTIANLQLLEAETSTANDMKSHPVGHGCDFVKLVFNTEGHSPLVSHFLKSSGLHRNAGQTIRIQRIEIDHLPPLDATTYKDVISESSKKIKKMKKDYENMCRQNQQENLMFIKEQQAELRHLMQKQSALLANKKEVKRLSDLIIMEQRKSEDSVSAGADVALKAALLAQE
ncbi:protein FAM227A-like isoform X2 [Biomphalaria glabrata]|uniref:Protein FAM227A-like isoform X2 n=1 Tax=Biomphalaria glabrata TaxID=6526 RepID=A0A9W2ZJ09_BIOGL|nr:protein FAM227A-like isoform X2 [Biomphalaria glabrata]